MDGRIFLTGGTGSLGKAILRRAREGGYNCTFTIFSRDEVKQSELKSEYPEHHFVLGDIANFEWLSLAMRGHEYVIHTSAYKQVPAAEVNVGTAIEVNVIGSRNVARAAIINGIHRVVGISTDKACAPINAYGMTKSLMEKIFQEADLMSLTMFTLVRYGNVLGSRGSVVPLFQRQRLGGVITITDPDMTRFWLTLDDAVDLVESGLRLDRGCILVPKASSSTMSDLALAIAPECDVNIIGTRPGEKKHEQLINSNESMHSIGLRDSFIIHPAYTGYRGNLPTDYEYNSFLAQRLCISHLSQLISGDERYAWSH